MQRFLIVDDDLDFTKALKATLESERYAVVTAAQSKWLRCYRRNDSFVYQLKTLKKKW